MSSWGETWNGVVSALEARKRKGKCNADWNQTVSGTGLQSGERFIRPEGKLRWGLEPWKLTVGESSGVADKGVGASRGGKPTARTGFSTDRNSASQSAPGSGETRRDYKIGFLENTQRGHSGGSVYHYWSTLWRRRSRRPLLLSWR